MEAEKSKTTASLQKGAGVYYVPDPDISDFLFEKKRKLFFHDPKGGPAFDELKYLIISSRCEQGRAVLILGHE